MRISDCSSDVCSSDLGHRPDILGPDQAQPVETLGFGRAAGSRFGGHGRTLPCSAVHAAMDGGGRFWRGRPAARGRFPWRVSVETGFVVRSAEHTSELQSLMSNSYAVFCLKKQIQYNNNYIKYTTNYK